jgi:hypothetical protein
MSTEIQKVENKPPVLNFIEKNNEEVIFKSNCKFCQSKYRLEAEEKYEQTKNLKSVHQFLLEKGEKVTYLPVRNHIIQHYIKQDRMIKIREYSDDLKMWLSTRTDRRSAIEERIAILNNEMLIIAAETEGQSLDERRKSADALKKVADTIMTSEDKIAEMDKSVEPVFIIVEKLKDIISIRVKKTSSEEVKRELMLLLDDLSESLKDLEIEKR